MVWFRGFVGDSRWRFAKTYVQSYPHEYTLREPSDHDNFRRAIDCIERYGAVEPFFNSRRKYLYLDDRKYWHMGNPSSVDPNDYPGLTNRSWIDVARYRQDAEKLGFHDDELDHLVQRWKSLLEKARRGSITVGLS